jgi:hypothetical protein
VALIKTSLLKKGFEMEKRNYLDGSIIVPNSKLDRNLIRYLMELQLRHVNSQRWHDFTSPKLKGDGTASVTLVLDSWEGKQQSVKLVLQELVDEGVSYYCIATPSADERLISLEELLGEDVNFQGWVPIPTDVLEKLNSRRPT